MRASYERRATLGALLGVAAVAVLLAAAAPTYPVAALTAVVLLVLALLAIPSQAESRERIRAEIMQRDEDDIADDERVREMLQEIMRSSPGKETRK